MSKPLTWYVCDQHNKTIVYEGHYEDALQVYFQKCRELKREAGQFSHVCETEKEILSHYKK